jgi:hypothetical protein
MATLDEIEAFLNDFHNKMKIFDIFYRDERGKNTQALADLEIRPFERDKVLENLQPVDYSEGPVNDTLYHSTDMWIFGRIVKGKEIYIKISMGAPGTRAICISFHIAEHALKYPLKEA